MPTERIAEVARKLGDRFDKDMTDTADLHAIRQFGSVLRHDYDAVNYDIIWNVVANTLPPLKAAFQILQAEHPISEKTTDPDFNPF